MIKPERHLRLQRRTGTLMAVVMVVGGGTREVVPGQGQRGYWVAGNIFILDLSFCFFF